MMVVVVAGDGMPPLDDDAHNDNDNDGREGGRAIQPIKSAEAKIVC